MVLEMAALQSSPKHSTLNPPSQGYGAASVQGSTHHSLISRRVNNVEQHGEEKIANQHRERGVHDRLSRRPANANRAFACGQSLVATDEHDEDSETERF